MAASMGLAPTMRTICRLPLGCTSTPSQGAPCRSLRGRVGSLRSLTTTPPHDSTQQSYWSKAYRRPVVHEAANAATPEAPVSRLRDGGEGLSDCGRERRRGSADQDRELTAVVEQRPVRRVGIPTGDGFCDRLGKAESS